MIALLAMAAPAPLLAQSGQVITLDDGTMQGEPPQRIRSILLTPGQTCPKPEGNEVVVCAPSESPYRIPVRLRDGPVGPASQSWATRALALDAEARRASGLPFTCSPNGTAGFTGCTNILLQNWAAGRTQPGVP
ncbi:MAG: hypothetical protein K2Y03_04510 [Sphingomonas sp.]|nr:hypothetical protein [Sphingomonas sp.]